MGLPDPQPLSKNWSHSLNAWWSKTSITARDQLESFHQLLQIPALSDPGLTDPVHSVGKLSITDVWDVNFTGSRGPAITLLVTVRAGCRTLRTFILTFKNPINLLICQLQSGNCSCGLGTPQLLLLWKIPFSAPTREMYQKNVFLMYKTFNSL